MAIKIAKIVEPPSIYLTKGLAAHSVAENYLLGNIDNVPSVLHKFKKEFESLRSHNAIPEEAIALDNKWNKLDDWMHDDAWLRLKLDARVDSYIVDFKTGKHYDEHIHQAKLYANVHMITNESCEEVDVEFWYLTSGAVKSYTFHRKDLDNDVADWEARVEKMVTDTEFKPTKNPYCKYCHIKNICPLYS